MENIPKFSTELQIKTQRWKPENNRPEADEQLLTHYIHMRSFEVLKLFCGRSQCAMVKLLRPVDLNALLSSGSISFILQILASYSPHF
jgi:hypothetical protein